MSPIVRHGFSQRRNRDSAYRQRNRRILLANATRCSICGEPPTASDPLEAGHIIPVAHGGSDDLTNLQAEHRSCNRRKGAL